MEYVGLPKTYPNSYKVHGFEVSYLHRFFFVERVREEEKKKPTGTTTKSKRMKIFFFNKQIVYVTCIFLSAASGLLRKSSRKEFLTSISSTFRDLIGGIRATTSAKYTSEQDIETSFSLWFDDSLKEVDSPIDLMVIGGPLPSYLSGILIKNGPASFGEVIPPKENTEPPSTSSSGRRYSHLFDGLAKLTKYEFTKQGKISFTSKFLHSSIYNRVVKEKGYTT